MRLVLAFLFLLPECTYGTSTVTDRSMPKMSCDQLAVAAKRLSPETPVLLLTGFGELMADRGERPEGVDLIVSKPVTLSTLRDAMAKLIAA